MRLIDAEKLPLEPKEANQFIPYEYASGWNDMLLNVLKAEQIDAVSVVRCKDCKFASDLDTDESAWCKNWNQYVWAEHFCSYGERKEGADGCGRNSLMIGNPQERILNGFANPASTIRLVPAMGSRVVSATRTILFGTATARRRRMTMPEYIEREALMRRIKEIHCAECDSYHGIRCRACWVDDTLDYIDSEPAADVECGGRLRGVTYEDGKVTAVHIRDTDDAVKVFAKVRHGRWIAKNGRIVCSECDAIIAVASNNDMQQEILEKSPIEKDEKFCYNCGAKMDGGEP